MDACAAYSDMTAYLEVKYEEVATFRGLSTPTSMIEVWSNFGTGTWTLLLVTADGQACMVGPGEGAEDVGPKKTGMRL